MRRAFNVALSVLAGLTALPLACGSSTIISVGADGGDDAAVDSARPISDATADTAIEPPSPVSEKPTPACHDLSQRGELVSIVANPAKTPSAKPIAEIAPGYYTIVSKTEYGTSGPIDFPAVRTTAYVSSTRFHLLIEGDQPRVAATFSWSIGDGEIERTYLCSSVGWSQKTFSQRIDASENGFTIYTFGTATSDGFIAERYVRLPD